MTEVLPPAPVELEQKTQPEAQPVRKSADEGKESLARLTALAAATELQPGAFVRAQLPKKNSWGSYRVERIEDGAIELLEFWERDEGLVWWVGSVTRIAAIDRLEGLEIRDSAPILVSSTRFRREGPEQTRAG
jgi:hypothetical protein